MNLMELYDLAENNNVKVSCFELNTVPCLSMQDDDYNCYIAIDPMQLNTQLEEKEYLAHELGHCVSGAFYTRSSPLEVKGQKEYRANLWAIKKLVPENELKTAIKNGNIELWQLAEYFEVSEYLIKFAVDYYSRNM